METKKSPILIYKENKDKIHTPEETKTAFENSYAVCFNYNRGHVGAKHVLFGNIWTLNPDVIITKVDLCNMASEPPIVWRNQLLLINRNGSREMSDEIIKLMTESGIISYEYRFTTEQKIGINVCFGPLNVKETPIMRLKGNLLIDGDKLLLTVRHMSKADSEALKSKIEE